MTIAMPVSSASVPGWSFGILDTFCAPRFARETFSSTWESLSEDVSNPPLTLVEIQRMLAGQSLDVTRSENATTYLEWVTSEGFASLEIGKTRFGFSFIADEGAGRRSVGVSGELAHRDQLSDLIRDYS